MGVIFSRTLDRAFGEERAQEDLLSNSTWDGQLYLAERVANMEIKNLVTWRLNPF